MRKIIFLTAALILFAASNVFGKPEEKPALKFEHSEWNFGTIKEVDGVVSHTFKFTNTLNTAVVIERVLTSCGCTTPEYSRRPILPKAQGEITINYDPEERPGRFKKNIGLICNSGQSSNVLIIEGVVEGRPKGVEELYPFNIGGGVRAEGAHRGFSYTPQGSTKSMTIGIVNTAKKSVSLSIKNYKDSGVLRVDYPKSLGADEQATITFTYDFTHGEHYGMLSDQVRLVVDGAEALVPFTTTAIGVDDFSKVSRREAPRFSSSPVHHNFGTVKRSTPLKCSVTIANRGKSPLIIRSVHAQQHTVTNLKAGTTIAPGATKNIEIELKVSSNDYGALFGGVTVVTNDPERAAREIRVSAIVED